MQFALYKSILRLLNGYPLTGINLLSAFIFLSEILNRSRLSQDLFTQ